MIITEPGLYDIPENLYHADPVPGGSLSSSMAKWLLPPSCPAIALYRRENPVIKTEFDLGSAAHKLILGKGAEIAVIQHEKWNTNVAKAEVADARAAGKIPLKPDQFAAAELMATSVRDHPTAGPLFRPGTGVPEHSIFWQDDRTGAWCRAMLDWLSLTPGYQPLIVDLKTISGSSLESVVKQIGNLRYYQQAAFYTTAAERLTGETPAFLFVFVDVNPPHLPLVFELQPDDLDQGRARNEEALDVWIACQESGEWPGYSTEIQSAPLPPWTHRQIATIE